MMEKGTLRLLFFSLAMLVALFFAGAPAFAESAQKGIDKEISDLDKQRLEFEELLAQIEAEQVAASKKKAMLEAKKETLLEKSSEQSATSASVSSSLGFEATGFVDMSLYSDQNAGSTGMAFDQVELDFTAKKDDKASTRFDVEFGGDGSIAIEQAFIEIYTSKSMTLTFGQFNAPIGFELLDAPDMFQYSHAMVFNNGLPTNLSGVMLANDFGKADISVYYVNGWDNNAEDNDEKTIGTRIGISPSDSLNLGISYITGKEGADDPATEDVVETPLLLSVTDIDFTYEGVPNVTIGAEYNMGTYAESSLVTAGDDATWSGYLLMVNYSISDDYAVTFRYDAFTDTEGARLDGGLEETRSAITVSPSFSIAEGLGGLVEYKMTTSDQEVFADADGNAKKDQTEIAAEITYSF